MRILNQTLDFSSPTVQARPFARLASGVQRLQETRRVVLRLRLARGAHRTYPERGRPPRAVLWLVQYREPGEVAERTDKGRKRLNLADCREVSNAAAKRAWARLILPGILGAWPELGRRAIPMPPVGRAGWPPARSSRGPQKHNPITHLMARTSPGGCRGPGSAWPGTACQAVAQGDRDRLSELGQARRSRPVRQSGTECERGRGAAGSHGGYDERVEMGVEFVWGDHHARPCLLNLATPRGIEAYQEHVTSAGGVGGYHVHSVSSKRVGVGGSSNPSSPRIRRLFAASVQPERGKATLAITMAPFLDAQLDVFAEAGF